jgi:tRNA pseudouridine55 synthase
MTRAEAGGVDGVLVLDKPAGPTSHDLVSRVRRALGQRRVGHAGTLDPFATGVLVCCVGRATRLVRWLSASDKAYEAVVRFGFATDTGDATGRPLGEPQPAPDAAAVRAAARRLTGRLLQVPPMYSAKKRGGRKLYELAREGREVEREAVDVSVEGWELGELEGERLRVRVTVSAGTYVRVLAEDLGRLAGCPAHLEALRRPAAGAFTLEGALAVGPGRDDGPSRDEALAGLVPLDRVPLPLPEAVLADDASRLAFTHGRAVLVPAIPLPTGGAAEAAVRAADGRLLGIAAIGEDGLLAPRVVLATAADA